MNTQPTPKTPYRISASFVGPIMNLDANLSYRDQNVIFATNGTGKSFIARAFRVLDDLYFENEDKEKIAELIASEEANQKDGIGTFSYSKGVSSLGSLRLDTQSKKTDRANIEFIYHVFSTDYIERELKSNRYELDGNIEHEIIIGQENTELSQRLAEQEKVHVNGGVKTYQMAV